MIHVFLKRVRFFSYGFEGTGLCPHSAHLCPQKEASVVARRGLVPREVEEARRAFVHDAACITRPKQVYKVRHAAEALRRQARPSTSGIQDLVTKTGLQASSWVSQCHEVARSVGDRGV